MQSEEELIDIITACVVRDGCLPNVVKVERKTWCDLWVNKIITKTSNGVNPLYGYRDVVVMMKDDNRVLIEDHNA